MWVSIYAVTISSSESLLLFGIMFMAMQSLTMSLMSCWAWTEISCDSRHFRMGKLSINYCFWAAVYSCVYNRSS